MSDVKKEKKSSSKEKKSSSKEKKSKPTPPPPTSHPDVPPSVPAPPADAPRTPHAGATQTPANTPSSSTGSAPAAVVAATATTPPTTTATKKKKESGEDDGVDRSRVQTAEEEAAEREAEAHKDAGNRAWKAQDAVDAIRHYTLAIDVGRTPSVHVYYSNRSAAFVATGERAKNVFFFFFFFFFFF
jgi:hypothetical protein